MTEKAPLLLPCSVSASSSIQSRPVQQPSATPYLDSRRNRSRLLPVYLLLLLAFFTPWYLSSQLQFSGPEVEALHPHFIAQCNRLLDPPNGTFISRLSALTDVLNKSGDPGVWIAEPGPSSSYFLSAFSSADWWLSERPFLVAIQPYHYNHTLPPYHPNFRITFLVPEFEKLRAELIPLPRELSGKYQWLSWREDESPYEVLRRELGEQRSIVVDGGVRELVAAGLRHAFGREAVYIGEKLKGDVGLMRERKDEREIGLLRCANQMTLHSIKKTRSRMRFGMTESRTRQILVEEMKRVGLEDGDGLVLFGENAALPHGSGTDRKLTKYDMILIDAGGKWGEYVADITRTFALPKSQISNHHLRIWETVRRAQLAPYEHLRSAKPNSTVLFSDLDIIARQIISHSFPPTRDSLDGLDYSVFTHRLGHGIGLEGHEAPYVVQGPLGQREVLPGHVFSLEPGVYIPHPKAGDVGVGVRLEDCFVVREGKEGRLRGEWLSGPVGSWGEL